MWVSWSVMRYNAAVDDAIALELPGCFPHWESLPRLFAHLIIRVAHHNEDTEIQGGACMSYTHSHCMHSLAIMLLMSVFVPSCTLFHFCEHTGFNANRHFYSISTLHCMTLYVMYIGVKSNTSDLSPRSKNLSQTYLSLCAMFFHKNEWGQDKIVGLPCIHLYYQKRKYFR